MIFCATEGDSTAITAINHLSQGADSEKQVVPCGELPPAGSVLIYTDQRAMFKKRSLRILRKPGGEKSPERIEARERRHADNKFAEPACASSASVVVALRPNAPKNQVHALECLYEQLTGKPFNPEEREASRERRHQKALSRIRGNGC